MSGAGIGPSVEKAFRPASIVTHFGWLALMMLETMVARCRDQGYSYHNVPFRLFPLFNIPVVNGEAIGEDYAFCDRWRACGGELWVDTTATIRHNGHHSYRGNLAETLDLRRRALPQV